MLKSTEKPWFCTSRTLDILPFSSSKQTFNAPVNLFRHTELFQLIKNLNKLTDDSSNDDSNPLNVSNKYRDLEYIWNLQSNIKSKRLSIFHHNVCYLSKSVDQLNAFLVKLNIDFDFIVITESNISKTNFSPINVALENYTIEPTDTD